MNPLDIAIYGFALLGALSILACWQDMKDRAALKKAGTPRTYPPLITQIQSGVTGFISSLQKNKESSRNVARQAPNPDASGDSHSVSNPGIPIQEPKA